MKRVLIRLLLAVLGLFTGAFLYIWQMLGAAVFTDIPITQVLQPGRPAETDPETGELLLPPDEDDLTGNSQSKIRLYAPAEYPILRKKQIDPMVTNILVFGVDALAEDAYVSRSDSMIVVSLDRYTDTVKMTSLMRDTEVAQSGTGRVTKLNAAYAHGGVGLMINTINEVCDLDIQRFVMLDMWSAAEVVDAVDGVTITVSEAELPSMNGNISQVNVLSGLPADDGLLQQAGEQTLSGKQAVGWARIRNIDSDYGRTSRQRELMTAVLAKLQSLNAIGQVDAAAQMLSMTATNISRSQMISLGGRNLSTLKNTDQYRVPADEFSQTNTSNWNIVVDWDKQVPALHSFIYGAYSTVD